MPGRLNEFALGSVYKTGSGGLRNAVTQTGNNLDDNVKSAVDSLDWDREEAAYRKAMND